MNLNKHFKKNADLGIFFLRIAVGLVFIVHGAGKLFNIGPFAAGIGGVSGFLAGLGVPSALFFAWIVALVEFVGGAFILLGLFTRYASIALIIEMIIAIILVHIPNGFYKSNGEIALVLLLSAVALLFSGAGKRLVLERQLFGKEF